MKLKLPFSRTFQNYFIEMQEKKQLAIALSGWSFSNFRVGMIKTETSDWEKHYLPVDLRGKVVLDIGAGEGETAMFFLKHGASKVVCVESCPDAYTYLAVNQRNHPHRITAINSKFQISQLNIAHDFLKMDIEGYEEVLLGVKLVTPAAVEVHGLQLSDKFEAAGWRIKPMNEECEKGYGCVKYAYWRC
jgi:hypothetical protein